MRERNHAQPNKFMNPIILSILHVLKQQPASIAHFAHTMMGWFQYAASRLLLAFHALVLCRRPGGYPRRHWRVASTKGLSHRVRSKPAWVQREVLRLKAMMPHSGCRKIADCFNRRFALARHMTVGKSYVSDTIRKHYHEIAILRRQIKNSKPKPVPHNLVWALDLTGKTTLDGRTRLVLAILEHSSRAALALEALHSKSSWALVGKLIASIKCYGKPSCVRTDNEAVFTSRVFRLALFLLGIRHQKTDLHCPWQNGRVERFFGSLKASLDQLAVSSFDALGDALGEFRFFYNHVRTHQHLGGATPAEAWANIDPQLSRFKQVFWFEAWDGLLAGFYLRR
jgi:putative transposase